MQLCFTPRKLLLDEAHGTLLICESDHGAIPYAERQDLAAMAEEMVDETDAAPIGIKVRFSNLNRTLLSDFIFNPEKNVFEICDLINIFYFTMSIHNFRVELTDTSSKTNKKQTDSLLCVVLSETYEERHCLNLQRLCCA